MTTKPIVRFSIPISEDGERFLGGAADVRWGWPSATSLAIAPDGTSIVFTAWEEADGERRSRLYVRRLDEHRARPLSNTDGASNPFFSPDGTWIGFFTGSSLRRVPLEGGGVETVVPDAGLSAEIAWGATWGDDGTIVYGGADGLYRVAATGGDARLIAEPDTLLQRLVQPKMLPGSAVALFHGLVRSYNPERSEIRAVELATGRQTTVLRDAMHPTYVDTGHMLFVRQGSLMAVDFDAERAVAVGEPVVVLEDVMQALFMLNTAEETGADQVEVGRPFPVLDPWPYITGTPTMHDIFPDGSFVAIRDTAAAVGQPLSTRLRAKHRVTEVRVVLNFAGELEERLGN